MSTLQPTDAARGAFDQARTELLALEAELSRRQKIYARRARIAPIFQSLYHPARYKGLYGGRGSAKSHTFAELLLDRHQLRKTSSVCVREFQVSLKQSVKRLLENKIQEFGLEGTGPGQFQIMNTYIKAPFGGLIIFQGMRNHTAESIKSLEAYDVAWVEEAQTLSQHSLNLLRPTIRAVGSEIWFSWNPRFATDPVDRLLRGDQAPPESLVIEANYKDNPLFPEELRKEMEWDRQRDPEVYNHVWLGAYERKSEARVFKNWAVRAFETPDDTTLYFGADWGFSVDPTVMVRCWIKDKTLFVDYEAYKVGCEIDDTPALFDTVPHARDWPSLADSARPETISYLNRNGYPRLEAAKKGPNSVKEGVIFLQGYDIVVHPRCVQTIDELTKYAYKTDALTGIVTPVLEDKKNHVIDSLRYAVERLREPEDWATW